jgi:hypothetical protein
LVPSPFCQLLIVSKFAQWFAYIFEKQADFCIFWCPDQRHAKWRLYRMGCGHTSAPDAAQRPFRAVAFVSDV